jgi:hypothetical protein
MIQALVIQVHKCHNAVSYVEIVCAYMNIYIYMYIYQCENFDLAISYRTGLL